MIINQVDDKVFEARLDYDDVENYDEVVSLMKSRTDNPQKFMELMTPAFHKFLAEVISEYNVGEIGGSDVGFMLEDETIIMVAKFFDSLKDSDIPEYVHEALENFLSNGGVERLSEIAGISPEDMQETLGNIIDGDAVDEQLVESESESEYPDADYRTSYFLFSSMSEAIGFCHAAKTMLRGSSVLYKVVDSKSPTLRGKYILEADVANADDERHLREFVRITNKEVGFSVSVIEHCEIVVKFDAVKKLAMC